MKACLESVYYSLYSINNVFLYVFVDILRKLLNLCISHLKSFILDRNKSRTTNYYFTLEMSILHIVAQWLSAVLTTEGS